jgi:glyoxylase I family protein
VADPLRSLEFYEKVVGLTPVRADEFREGKAPFPSVRVSGDSIIDLMAKVAAPLIDHMVGASGTARESRQSRLHRDVAWRRRSAAQAAG